MKFYQIFKASLHEPKKLAAFRLLSIGKVIQYIFVFIFLYTGRIVFAICSRRSYTVPVIS